MTLLRRSSVFVSMAALTMASLGQVTTNSVFVVNAVTSEFSLVGAAGGVTHFPIGSFGGTTSPGTAQSILWDPFHPGSAIVGGFGFVGRVTINGPTAVYAPLTTGISTAAQMSFDTNGSIIVFDAGVDQVRRVDPVSGVVTNITSGGQPWGTSLNAGAVDPITGDIYVGGNNNIYRIPAGTSSAVAFASAWAAGTSFVGWIGFDPLTHEVVAGLLSVNRIVRISAFGVLTDIVPPGTIVGPNGIEADANGDFIVAGGSTVSRIPNLGGVPTVLGTVTGPTSTLITGLSVVNDAFRLFVNPAGGGAEISMTSVPAATSEGYTLASFDTSSPVGSGPVLGFTPDALTFALLTAFPVAVPGDLIHWHWPVSAPLYPAASFALPPGTLTGITLDMIGISLDPSFTIRATPSVRVAF